MPSARACSLRFSPVAGGGGAVVGGEAAKNEVENNSLVLVAPPSPLPGKTPTPVQDALEGKPNQAELIAKEVKASIAGVGQAVSNPAELLFLLLGGFNITTPIYPNLYAKSYGENLAQWNVVCLAEFSKR